MDAPWPDLPDIHSCIATLQVCALWQGSVWRWLMGLMQACLRCLRNMAGWQCRVSERRLLMRGACATVPQPGCDAACRVPTGGQHITVTAWPRVVQVP